MNFHQSGKLALAPDLGAPTLLSQCCSLSILHNPELKFLHVQNFSVFLVLHWCKVCCCDYFVSAESWNSFKCSHLSPTKLVINSISATEVVLVHILFHQSGTHRHKFSLSRISCKNIYPTGLFYLNLPHDAIKLNPNCEIAQFSGGGHHKCHQPQEGPKWNSSHHCIARDGWWVTKNCTYLPTYKAYPVA